MVLRLSDIKGKPLVKIGAADNGAGLNVLDGTDDGVVINARRTGTYIKLANQGKETLSLPKPEK